MPFHAARPDDLDVPAAQQSVAVEQLELAIDDGAFELHQNSGNSPDGTAALEEDERSDAMVVAKRTGPSRARGHLRLGGRWRLRSHHGCVEWDADDVAEHLIDRMSRIVTGLARRTPWAGIDRETLDELYLSAAATVSRLAASGERTDWRTPRHLERAAIAAFRHEALAHWKTVNAQKRRGDRDAAPFDPGSRP